MTTQTLAGVVAAWSATHTALGLYFVLAYLLGRREREFLLFSFMCFALSVASAGNALDYSSSDPENNLTADKLVHAGAILAAAVNVHFALDDFAFDTQFLAQAVYFGFKLGGVPVPVRYFEEASSINFRRSVKYGFSTLWILAQFWLQKLRLARFRIFTRPPIPS